MQGSTAITRNDLPPLPDDVIDNPTGAHLDPRAWFPDPDAPLHIEIGCGKGTFVVQEAPPNPGVNYLAIEWAGEFARYAADRVARHALGNVRVMHTDAGEFLHWRVPDAIVTTVHLYFPDPWPKTRHHRRRMLQDRFLADCERVLIPGGELRVVTDHDGYWAWMEEHFARWTGPGATRQPPPFVREPFQKAASAGSDEIVGTNFERKYRREGRPFNAAVLRKQA